MIVQTIKHKAASRLIQAVTIGSDVGNNSNCLPVEWTVSGSEGSGSCFLRCLGVHSFLASSTTRISTQGIRTMAKHVDRREFLQKSALRAAAIGSTAISVGVGRAVEPPPRSPQPSSANCRSLTPKMLLKGTAALSKPLLAASQLSFRIGLARTRTAAYPLDSLDFIMMDLERPDEPQRAMPIGVRAI